jgi:hypothetical protein
LDPKIQLFLYFLAGITFAFAAINLIIGFQKGNEKTYLFLGSIGACVGIYYLLFPHMTFTQPLSLVTKAGFFFFLANFALVTLVFFLLHGVLQIKSSMVAHYRDDNFLLATNFYKRFYQARNLEYISPYCFSRHHHIWI